MLTALAPHLAINPSEDQATFFETVDPNCPYTVINLHIYRERAVYPENFANTDVPENLSGQQAYHLYLDFLRTRIISSLTGVRIVNLPIAADIIGENTWQELVIGSYANREAMFSLNHHPLYEQAAMHREAALQKVNTVAITGNLLNDFSSIAP